MGKLILLGILGYVLWYLFAPMFTQLALRIKRNRRVKGKDNDKIIEGKGRIID